MLAIDSIVSALKQLDLRPLFRSSRLTKTGGAQRRLYPSDLSIFVES
jgi:hypothetical protein